MKSTLAVTALSMLAALCSGGCSTSQTMSGPAFAAERPSLYANQPVALTSIGPEEGIHSGRGYRLGAGDQLGQAIFANYAAIARANAGWHYASGSTME